MATQRREESEWRAKRQRSCISREGGDAFKASATRGRLTQGFFLRTNVGDEEKVDIIKDCQRSQQSD
jgi:hypothetical protein